MKIEPYIDSIRETSPLSLKTLYKKEHWLSHQYHDSLIVNYIENISEEYSSGISRNDIIKYLSNQNNSLVQGFLMTMIWGHGYTEHTKADNRGPWKVSQMLPNLNGSEKKLEKVKKLLLDNDLIEACNLFEDMKRCKISFYSKFLYFLGKGISMSNYPLIFDARVGKTIGQLISTDQQMFSILEVRQSQDPKAFKIYVERIHELSKLYNVEADNIEFFLFKGI